MKKVIVMMSVVLFMLSTLTVTTYALVEYEGSYNYDYTKSAVVSVSPTGDTNYVARFYYNPGNGSSLYCRSNSSVYLTKGQYGYAASTTTAINGQSDHKYWGGQSTYRGWHSSPQATVVGQRYAKSLYFYADFRASSNNITTIYKMYGY